MTPKSPTVPVQAFVEGATEVAVIKGLARRGQLCLPEFRAGGDKQPTGKEAVIPALQQRVREWAKLPEDARSPLRILVVLDQDTGPLASVAESVRGALRACGLVSAELVPLPQQERVFVLTSPSPKLRLALHIAGNPAVCQHFPALTQRSMDDDVLLLAMQRATAEGLLAARHESRRVLGVDRLLAKVGTEIPTLMQDNGLSPFVFAKDHIRFYAAVLGTSTSPAKFAEAVVEHASPEALQATFAPLVSACAAL